MLSYVLDQCSEGDSASVLCFRHKESHVSASGVSHFLSFTILINATQQREELCVLVNLIVVIDKSPRLQRTIYPQFPNTADDKKF